MRDQSKVKPLVIKILINECYSLLRKKKHEIPTDILPEGTEADPSTARTVGDLKEALLALPEPLRIPIALHYMEGFSIQEIASVLGCPKGTVLSRMNRGRKQLKNLLGEEETEYEA